MELKIKSKEQQMIDAFEEYIKTKGNIVLDYCLEDYMQVALNYISSLEQKYDKTLEILANRWPPCEKDGFMDKNTDYCSMNCGVDEEIFKKCWDKYIEQCLKEVE